MSSLNRFDTAQWMFDRQRYAEAIAVLMDLLGENPGLAPIHALLALCQCALRQNALAVHHAEKAVELAPSDPENHFTVSQTLVRLFDWELGIVDNGCLSCLNESLAGYSGSHPSPTRQPKLLRASGMS